jgi:predicted protein tyrosine phosphatase
MSRIEVVACSIFAVGWMVRTGRYSHLASALCYSEMPVKHKDENADQFKDNYLFMGIGDRTDQVDDMAVPRFLRWCRRIPDGGRLLIHSGLGISRAPALALAAILDNPCPGDLPDIDLALGEVLRHNPAAAPNLGIVMSADVHLNLNGKLVSAVEKLRPRAGTEGGIRP